MIESFRAFVVSETGNGNFERRISDRKIEDLPEGDVLIRVAYSSLNYKDALSASGNRGITRNYPHTPGIDAAGVVAVSRDGKFSEGEEVIVTGFDLGMDTPGGFGQYIRVPASWVLKKPEGLTLKECMIYGTAGYTAALSVERLAQHGVNPDAGEILVTGATGGVGILAVSLLAGIGFKVVAATGKAEAEDFLKSLGACQVVSRESVRDLSGKALLKGRWAGVVDTVGGEILSSALKSTQYGGSVTCCGMVASTEFSASIFPFILRGVNLLGIDAAQSPMDLREKIWGKLAGNWKPGSLESIASFCLLEELDERIEVMLAGRSKGRVVVSMQG